MKKNKLGNTGYDVSRIIYGGIVSTDVGQEKSDIYVENAIKAGVNYFDIAPSYGDAQEKLGVSLKNYRKDVYLACKTTCRLAEDAKKEFEQSLKHLYTDHFDVYQLHSLTTMEDIEQAFSKDGVLNMLLDYKKQGVINKLGISCHNEDVALRALELYDFDTVLFPTNWGICMGNGFGSRITKVVKEKGIGLLGMKSMIERAWDDEERYASPYPKSWCKPFDPSHPALLPAMRYATGELGADVIVTPGNYEHFSFAIEHEREVFAPYTDADRAILEKELTLIDGRYFFPESV